MILTNIATQLRKLADACDEQQQHPETLAWTDIDYQAAKAAIDLVDILLTTKYNKVRTPHDPLSQIHTTRGW